MSSGQHPDARDTRDTNVHLDEARVIALMQAYMDAEYRWERDGEWHRLLIGEHATELEAMFPDGREFGLLSAWNPQSVEQPESVNRAADTAMHAALRACGLEFRPGFCSARNRSWREPSWLVIGLPLHQFDTLSRHFRQLGTLYCRRGEPIRLRMYHARPAGMDDAAVTGKAVTDMDCVDWLPAT